MIFCWRMVEDQMKQWHIWSRFVIYEDKRRYNREQIFAKCYKVWSPYVKGIKKLGEGGRGGGGGQMDLDPLQFCS